MKNRFIHNVLNILKWAILIVTSICVSTIVAAVLFRKLFPAQPIPFKEFWASCALSIMLLIKRPKKLKRKQWRPRYHIFKLKQKTA
jgi:FtsH-binding integral membrane protein